MFWPVHIYHHLHIPLDAITFLFVAGLLYNIRINQESQSPSSWKLLQDTFMFTKLQNWHHCRFLWLIFYTVSSYTIYCWMVELLGERWIQKWFRRKILWPNLILWDSSLRIMSVMDKYCDCVSRLSISVSLVHLVFQKLIFWYLMNHIWFNYRHEYCRHELNTSIETFYERFHWRALINCTKMATLWILGMGQH
jgi:hypothetical protein